jgi:outer membrane immunogenic protein
MKKLLLGAVGVVAFGMAVPASAADLAARPYTKAPPIAVAAYDWSGFYVGINGGGGSSRNCWEFTTTFLNAPVNPPGQEGCHDATGGTVGGQIGYRWQSAAWVFGVEAQGNWANFTGSNLSTLPPLLGLANRTKIDAFGLFTGQVGYSWNNFLVYVKGGAAVTSDKYEVFLGQPFGPDGQTALAVGQLSDVASETRWGGVVGIGGEYGFTPNWSFGLEYDHMFMGNSNNRFTNRDPVSAVPVGGFSGARNISQDVDLFTARLNYRFGGPVVAKY